MILVTGASGLVGQYLIKELVKEGTPIRALYLHSAPEQLSQLPNLTWERCDLLDVSAVEICMDGVDQVYNCAATVSFDKKDKTRLIRDNVAIVENVVNAALNAGVQKLVHVSSTAAIGRWKENRNGEKLLLDEEVYFNQLDKRNSRYALGKFLGEMEVWRAEAEGLATAIVNPGIILGAGNWDKGSSNLIKFCYEEFPWYTKGVTGWVDVEDVVRAMILLMKSEVHSQRFLLCEGNYEYQEIFTKMALALGKRPPHKEAKPWMAEVVWRWSYLKSWMLGQKPTLTKETARAAQNVYKFSSEKILKQFPEFKFTPIEETIHRVTNAFLKHRD